MMDKPQGKSVSDIQSIFSVDRDTVLKWCYHFKQYLPSEKERMKGNTRRFEYDDILVFAYIYEKWEENSDIEAIEIGLNREEYREDRFKEIADQNTPFFIPYPDDYGVFVGTDTLIMAMGDRSQIEIARGYKEAANLLIDQLNKNIGFPHDVGYSILFLYRHSLELYLKEISGYAHDKSKKSAHSILNQLEAIEKETDKKTNPWIKERLEELNLYDPNSKAFRYADLLPQDSKEILVNLSHLHIVVNNMIDAFEIYLRRNAMSYI